MSDGKHAAGNPSFDQIRRFRRHLLDVRLAVTVQRHGVKTTIYGRCKHIGEGGLGGIMAGELNPQEIVALEFSLPGVSDSVKIPRAVVRYRHGFHHGFEFLTLTPQQMETIKKSARSLPEATA